MTEEIPPIDLLVATAKKVFKEEFDADADIAVAAPGRVNLIGEHTDYNDGFVMPMALPLVTVIVGKKIDGNVSTIVTTNKDINKELKRVSIEMPHLNSLDRTLDKNGPKWSLYVKGVISNYIGNSPPAFQAVINSSVPTGGGLSSSAALEVSTYTFLDALTGSTGIKAENKAKACQIAEHEYAGMPCGIMDQFISFLGKKDHALLIDCRNLRTQLIPLKEHYIVTFIINSNVKHELTGSEYATRRKHCEEAALLLKKVSLRDANQFDINYLISIEANKTLIKRARHVITEIERTEQAAKALIDQNYTKFGQLMVASHKSLRDDYEVSCPELDQLVELALSVNGVLGSRMTGGGFGGCTVSIMYYSAVNEVIDKVNKNYKGQATFYICHASEGSRILSNV